MRKGVNKYQIEYIKNLTSHEHKNELIEIFNECTRVLFNEYMNS